MTAFVPDWILLAQVSAIVLLAGFVQGLAGFGSGLIAVPLLITVLGLATAVPVFALAMIAITAVNLHDLRAHIDWRPVIPMIGGYVLGTPLGIWFLLDAPVNALMGVLGGLLIGYALWSLRGGGSPRWMREWPVALGAASGAMGAAFSANGPPVIVHVMAQDWHQHRRKAVLALFFGISTVITSLSHAVAGLVTTAVVFWVVVATPALLLGTFLGIRVYRRFSDHDYRRMAYGLILMIGLGLLVRTL
ncbi:MAG: sulfite exporter TauE/SafE family protein [Gammaproteobacteria bacterium]